MLEVMVMYMDDDKLPRAYAFGPANEQPAVEAEAERQLYLYLSRKLVEGTQTPPGYTKEVVLI